MKMELITKYSIILCALPCLNLLSATYVVKREQRLPIQKQKRLYNPYSSVQLSSFNLIICGLICLDNDRCIASSLTKSNLICELYDDQSGNAFIDTDATLIYMSGNTQPTPLTWPRGTYTLMKPFVGCPGSDVNWKEGSLYQDTEDDQRYGSYVVSTNMSVIQDEYKNIQVYFCTKDTSIGDESDWSAGNYCILKYGLCPVGFDDGYIKWDDENKLPSANSATGTLPDGVYDIDTTVYYCCRDDGNAGTEIYLPSSDPFYLLRYTSTCQSVHYMFVSEETIEWDCQDGGLDGDMGVVHPFQDGSENNIKLHFCYYYI